ncbi:hypothetical protein C5D34_11185 [Rathayibacter sp. AY1B1]|uniref:hypothetical protein n=1 Tax=unclassified Rathayibacter TaxID=2609250 RepID=UPI000CE8ECCD|nr:MULTISPECIES: hypothetical protein [unclassified Rathayibacter]PPI32686.1 hypothetical protein C5D34_11185 [Rathayibacter sp. AY1B1]
MTHIDSVDPSAEHSGTPDSWTVPTSGRPARRTIVQGAAWTIPVVAASVATPAFAASTPLALAFDAPAYTFAACTTRSVSVLATTGGTPAAGAAVTITLPAGLTSGGAQTVSATTGSDGRVSIPVTAGNVAQTGLTLTAVAGATTAGATASTTATEGSAIRYVLNNEGASTTSNGSVPSGASPVGPRLYLTASGDLYHSSTKLASGVTSAQGFRDQQNRDVADFVADGVFYRFVSGDPALRVIGTGVPAGSTVHAPAYYVTPSGELRIPDGTLVTTGVTSADSFRDASNLDVIDVLTGTEIVRYIGTTKNQVVATGVQAGSTVLTPGYHLTPDGRLFNGGLLITTGVTSADAFRDQQNRNIADVIQNGALVRYGVFADVTAPQTRIASGVPSDATAYAPDCYVTKDGRAFNGGQLIATGVASAFSFRDVQGRTVFDTMTNAICP